MDKRLQPGTKIQFTNETLNTAFSDQQAFYELYAAVTNRAIDFYAKSGRRKFALKLHGTLSALEVYVSSIKRRDAFTLTTPLSAIAEILQQL